MLTLNDQLRDYKVLNLKKSEQNYGMTYLIDYNEDHAETILRDADAVCLCHSIAETHDPEKLFESCEKWLSFVRLQVTKMVNFRPKMWWF